MSPVGLNQIFAFFFHAAGRVSPREYRLGIGVAYALAFALLIYVLFRMDEQPAFTLLLLAKLPLTVAIFVLVAKRCHDLGLPGTFVLLLLVPLVGIGWLIALAFIPGTPGANSYGPEPRFLPD